MAQNIHRRPKTQQSHELQCCQQQIKHLVIFMVFQPGQNWTKSFYTNKLGFYKFLKTDCCRHDSTALSSSYVDLGNRKDNSLRCSGSKNGSTLLYKKKKNSVADPGCLSHPRIFSIPDSESRVKKIPDLGSKKFRIPEPHQRI